MRGDNAWNMELASAKTMRVTGTDTKLSPSGGGRGDSMLPYKVSFGPAIRICFRGTSIRRISRLSIAFCRAFPDQVGADNEAPTKSTTVEKSVGYGVRDHERSWPGARG